MTIHADHPFMPAEGDRSLPRRLRGRLVLPVTLWTAGGAGAGSAASLESTESTQSTERPARRRAGLTVASVLVVDGEPGHVLGVLDEESDLAEALTVTGVAVVTLLTTADRDLADVFGYVAPSPGGPFAAGSWHDGPWGPVLQRERTWAGVRLVDVRTVGYGSLVDTVIERIELAPEPGSDVSADSTAPYSPPLALRRGRYGTIFPPT